MESTDREMSRPRPGRLRIAMVTSASRRGESVLFALGREGIVVDELIIDRLRLKGTRQVLRNNGPAEVFRRISRRARARGDTQTRHPSSWHRYGVFARSVSFVDDINGTQGRVLLERTEPDLIVLGPSRILTPETLSIAKVATLNPHPGLLPDYRGVDVVRWAIRNGDPVGVSVHLVDEGIDTGAVLVQREVPLRDGDTIGDINRRVNALSGHLMAGVVARYVRGETPEPIAPARVKGSEKGKLWPRMSPGEREEVDRILADSSTVSA